MPPRYLPLDDPNRKQITSSIKSKVKAGLKKLLLPQEFVFVKSKWWVRKTKTMVQNLRLRQSHITFDIISGYDFCDPYKEMLFPESGEHYPEQIHRYWDLPLSVDDVPVLADTILSDFEREGLAFFNKYRETSDLIRDFEAKIIDDSVFAESIDWRPYNIGISYANMNENKKAIASFQEVIDKWSDEKFDWVQTRKKMCELWIEKLRKGG